MASIENSVFRMMKLEMDYRLRIAWTEPENESRPLCSTDWTIENGNSEKKYMCENILLLLQDIVGHQVAIIAKVSCYTHFRALAIKLDFFSLVWLPVIIILCLL